MPVRFPLVGTNFGPVINNFRNRGRNNIVCMRQSISSTSSVHCNFLTAGSSSELGPLLIAQAQAHLQHQPVLAQTKTNIIVFRSLLCYETTFSRWKFSIFYLAGQPSTWKIRYNHPICRANHRAVSCFRVPWFPLPAGTCVWKEVNRVPGCASRDQKIDMRESLLASVLFTRSDHRPHATALHLFGMRFTDLYGAAICNLCVFYEFWLLGFLHRERQRVQENANTKRRKAQSYFVGEVFPSPRRLKSRFYFVFISDIKRLNA
jgi:hypothetical protein